MLVVSIYVRYRLALEVQNDLSILDKKFIQYLTDQLCGKSAWEPLGVLVVLERALPAYNSITDPLDPHSDKHKSKKMKK